MGRAAELREVEISALKPYAGNAKRHGQAQLDQLAQSISRLGFISPILIDRDFRVIAGHGRIQAAKQAGLNKVPCVFVEGLSEAERKAYTLADNRLAELSDWNMEKVTEELRDLQMGAFDFGFLGFDVDLGDMAGGFDEPEGGGWEAVTPATVPEAQVMPETMPPEENHKPWTNRGMRCDMVPNITSREKSGKRYISLHAVTKEGKTLEEIKNDKTCERQLAEELVTFIRQSLSGNLSECGWAIITTGRRRHRDGYHFATEICRKAAMELRIPFYEGAIECGNSDRLKPELKIVKAPKEKNLILFDDVITTGNTMVKTIELLAAAGYTVMPIIGIRNQ